MLEPLDSIGTDLKADFCVAGAGPAGIALALTLGRLGHRCVLLEAGGLEPRAEDQDPYAGTSGGLPYPLASSRLRYLGGTSGHWGGWCKPLDAADFSLRPGAHLPSWPIERQVLEMHYGPAAEWCELAGADFDPESSVAEPARDLLFRGDAEFTQQLFRFSPPTRFGTRYRADLEGSDLVTALFDATLVGLEWSGRAVAGAAVQSRTGHRTMVEAGYFILAMGGIENARFLLHAMSDEASGRPIESGLVGQGFMDHFGFSPGNLVAASGLKYYRHRVHDAPLMPVITVTESFQAAEDLPSVCIMAQPDAPSARLPPAYFANPGILHRPGIEITRYRLQLMCEPTSIPASQVRLGQERDGFGVPRAHLEWHVDDADFRAVERFLGAFERAVGRAGLGRVQRTRRFTGDARRQLTPGLHHLGTTRMGTEPQHGVVDPDCRVFGTDNLYVAGSSVFPRAGYSNPTLTLLALANRLAFHLHDLAT